MLEWSDSKQRYWMPEWHPVKSAAKLPPSAKLLSDLIGGLSGSSHPRGLERADKWIPGTRPGMTSMAYGLRFHLKRNASRISALGKGIAGRPMHDAGERG